MCCRMRPSGSGWAETPTHTLGWASVLPSPRKTQFQDGVRALLLLQLARECFHTQAEFIKLIINYFPNGAFSQTNNCEFILSLLLSFWGANHAPPPRQHEEPARGEYLIWI